MKRPRLKDIADRVGCSIAIVSHVVNQSSGNISCRDELRDLILQTAAELNYVPYYTSRVLKNQHSRTIGLYIPPIEATGIGYPYESTLLTGIERICREKAYDLLIINTGSEVHNAEYVATRNSHRIDGLILIHAKSNFNGLFTLAEKTRNAVAINYYGDAPIDTINFNDKAAAALAVTELHRAGHRRIAYVGPTRPNADRGAHLRLEGFISTCVSLGITVDPTWIFDETFPGSLPLARTVSSEFKVAQRIAENLATLPSDQRPTAIIGYSDHDILYVMRELQRLNLRSPADISAIGINDSTICPFAQPQLSSIRQPLITIGEDAAKHVVEKSEQNRAGQFQPPETQSRWFKLSEPTFIQRESVRDLNAT